MQYSKNTIQVDVFVYLHILSEVWGKFLEFETTSGDLASLVKVENRKLEIYREVS